MKQPPKYLMPQQPKMPVAQPTQPSGLREALGMWATMPSGQRPKLWAFFRQHAPWALSHHPPHENFKAHTFQWRGVRLCQGCVMTWLGTAVGLILSLAPIPRCQFWARELELHAAWGVWAVAVAFLILLLPTLATAFISVPRPIKWFARFLLGVLIGSAIVYIFSGYQDWPKFVIILVFLATRIPLEIMRKRKNQKEWDSCLLKDYTNQNKKPASKYKTRKTKKR